MRHSLRVKETLNRFVEWGSQHDTVRAMVLTSSFTTNKAPVDVLSDYDLILVVTDIHPFVKQTAWLGDFGPLLVHYADPILNQDGLETSGFVVQYEDGLKIDFTMWPVDQLKRVAAAPELPEEFDAGYQVLLDKDDLTCGLQPPTYQGYIPKPPTEAEYLTRIELLFHNATYVAKFLWRDDLVAARHVMETAMLQADFLPMLEWRSEIDHGWSVKPGPYGRRLKRWVRPELWDALAKTYTGPDLDANWDAMFRLIDLFRKVAIEVGEILGFAYPYDMDRRAAAYLQRVRDLDRDAETFGSARQGAEAVAQ
jgi:aminoglycoside 6-adenylyltransferase